MSIGIKIVTLIGAYYVVSHTVAFLLAALSKSKKEESNVIDIKAEEVLDGTN